MKEKTTRIRIGDKINSNQHSLKIWIKESEMRTREKKERKA